MPEFIIKAVIIWVNGTRADGVLALEPCNNRVQVLVRGELQKGAPAFVWISGELLLTCTDGETIPRLPTQFLQFLRGLLDRLRRLRGRGRDDCGGPCCFITGTKWV